ncbi:hypothetical protein C2G38_2181666 [Gigaspora rosea]|uniref:Uncharacterized protein n=1 Tax=Gigaspora rosea TaxID=44941 RepID=A0A397VAN1_9GLOM|nr:hypothetical protein C2G38_2181666 [Gigaspora rosea]
MLRKCIRSNISGCIQREKDLQPHESYILQNTASHALLGTINDEEDISNSDSLQKNLSDRDQHINNYCSTNSEDCSSDSDSFQENFSYRNQLKFMASNMLSSSNQLTNTEEVELEIEDAKEFRQTIVDSGIDFQQLKYENLVCIIQYPNFQPEHNMKTPSTSRPFKNTYTISVSKHIKRVLSNRTLYSQMYFGPRIGAETKSEFWHRNIWQESPLFSQSSIQINQGSFIKFKSKETRVRRITAIVSTSSGMKLKVQYLYYSSELPKIFATLARSIENEGHQIMASAPNRIYSNSCFSSSKCTYFSVLFVIHITL